LKANSATWTPAAAAAKICSRLLDHSMSRRMRMMSLGLARTSLGVRAGSWAATRRLTGISLRGMYSRLGGLPLVPAAAAASSGSGAAGLRQISWGRVCSAPHLLRPHLEGLTTLLPCQMNLRPPECAPLKQQLLTDG
jgi:hypothetical protein